MLRRILGLVATAAAVVGLALVAPSGSGAVAAADIAPRAACASAWDADTAYNGGATVSHGGRNWVARWWTRNQAPGTADVWADQGACDGGPAPGPGCDYPAWSAAASYLPGDIVRYTDGNLYIAVHANPGYDPVISHWYWDPYDCDGQTDPPDPGGFVVSEAQFNQMFPNRNPFYTYGGLVSAMGAFPGFATTGSDTVRRQEAAAFLANVSHETGGLVHIVEQNEANYPHYCDANQPYGCPAGQSAYYGRGPIQLSWNFNYKAAGDTLGLPLLTNPWLVQNDAVVSWKAALWYWMTQSGPGTMSGHTAMVGGYGFGESIRSINGAIECDGGNPGQVQSRVDNYQRFTQMLGVPTGGNLYC